MGNIAYILCPRTILYQYQAHLKTGPVTAIINRFFRKVSIEELIQETELFTDLHGYTVNLPDDFALLKANIGKLDDHIREFCVQKNVKSCITHKDIIDALGFKCCTKCEYDGHRLYKALFVPIIEKVSVMMEMNLRDMDISILAGTVHHEMYMITELLAPYVRYMTVVTDDREAVERDLDKITDETGLAIRVTGDCRAGTRNARCIINLDPRYSKLLKAGMNAAVINFSDKPMSYMQNGGRIIVNSICVGLPQEFKNMYDGLISEYFSELEFAEAVLFHKAYMQGLKSGSCSERDIMASAAAMFREYDFKIKSFAS